MRNADRKVQRQFERDIDPFGERAEWRPLLVVAPPSVRDDISTLPAYADLPSGVRYRDRRAGHANTQSSEVRHV